ncbi:MAG: hypothetical protein GXP18_00200 [Gammaproteobacteria bacterium]|nr:hypothetical protein [Gammaproteobacteria bacterium]
MRKNEFVIAGMLVLVSVVVWVSPASAARIADIRNTKHNFSDFVTPDILGGGDTRTVKATEEAEICVFCHTPHGANQSEGPLWNRAIPSSASYTVYSSGSIDSSIQQPNGASKLCLSCHDGSIAIGSVRNSSGSGGFQSTAISMTGTGSGGVMAPGEGNNTGYTRFLGKDLSNDHPVSLTYNQALFNADGEMRDPTQDPIRVRGLSPRPQLQDIHLQPAVRNAPTPENGQVQCISCHDPHIRDTTEENIKFLRLNRLQKAQPDGSDNFLPATDIICLACHTKAGWEGSAHAQPGVANEIYTNAAADVREFAQGTAVWQTACLACHDTHTVQGSRRLLRGGTDGSTLTSASGYTIKAGDGNYSVEETCFACHSSDGGTLTSQGMGTEVPDIKVDFNMPIHMPIRSSEQAAGTEVHDIGSTGSDTQELNQRGKDFIESRANLGKISMGGSLNNRHVECTDCHNPHRVTRRRQFNQDNLGGTLDAAGTHNHDNASPHTNIASGVLRGMWGVEPVYTSNNFYVEPTNFNIKRGDPGANGSTAVTQPYVTREYQICLKCHSNYGYDQPPLLGVSSVTTPSGVNGMTRYTNQAREYNSPASHAGEPRSVGTDGGAGNNNGFTWNTNNHRGWHPVLQPTGRTPSARATNQNNWINPFNNAVGTQTMYCSDCHGSNTPAGTADPDPGQENGPVWGPHGSTNYFLLKGDWSGNAPGSPQNDFTGRPGTGDNDSGNDATTHLCFKCHRYEQYASPSGGSQASGFAGMGCMCLGMGGMGGGGNFHRLHATRVTNFRCNLCHVAVPHGWKNKNFLVNLNDVGEEAGFPAGSSNEVRNSTTNGYVQGPYYNRAVLKVRSFARSGSWSANNCGSIGVSGNGAVGVGWMVGMGGMGGGMGGMGGGGGGGSEACGNVP